MLKVRASDEMKEYIKNEFGKRRYELGISQAEMASKLEISTRQYSNLETGKSLCSMKTLALFLEHIGVNKDEFISGLVETFKSE